MDLIGGFMWILIFVAASFRCARAQDSGDEKPTVIHSAIRGPDGLSIGSFPNAVAETQVYLGWIPVDGIQSYILRTYRADSAETLVLVRKISNIQVSVFLVASLEPGTEYIVTVSAVFDRGDIFVESRESDQLRFRTKDVCQGGQIQSQCNAHCVSTCRDPDPVCRRICTPGCACPLNASIWHQGKCIRPQSCPSPRGRPVSVTGLLVLPSVIHDASVTLAWDIQSGAQFYLVRVRLASNRSVIIREFEVIPPITRITNLKEGNIYIFGVQAFIRHEKDQTLARTLNSALRPPLGITVSDVGETNFTVSWLSNVNAAKYSFALFDESENNVLYENGDIAGNSIIIEKLTPGTNYYFSLATAGPRENFGAHSPLQRVTTLGMKNDSINNPETTIVLRVETPPTTSQSPTSGNTRCLLRYQSVQIFYKHFPNRSGGPRYPICDADGNYVTNLCQRDDPNICWCIGAEDGMKKTGSDYGGTNSNFPLDCDRFGVLSTESLELRVIEKKTTSLTVVWRRVEAASAYIITMQNSQLQSDQRTISVDAESQHHKIEDLVAGTNYVIGIYIADSTGGTSPLQTIQATTNVVDTPAGLRIVANTANNLTVTWIVDPTVEYFRVTLIDASTYTALRELDHLMDYSVTLSGLQTLTHYIVLVRAVALQYTDDNGDPETHVSEPARIEVLIQCSLPAVDIIFGFDISRRATWSGLQSTKNLAANILESLPKIEVGSLGTRVAAMRYYRSVSTVFNFDRFKKTANAVGAIRYMRYNGGLELYTGRLLDRITNDFFITPLSQSYRVRSNALSVVIIFSLGPSSDSYAQQATRLKNHTNVMTIGVAGRSNTTIMQAIASKPSLSILTTSFADLKTANELVLQRLCTLAQNV